jgi:hypothetical protein
LVLLVFVDEQADGVVAERREGGRVRNGRLA